MQPSTSPAIIYSLREYAIVTFIALFCYIILSNAWVTEDAFITFRTLENFVNGYGLTWNITERVQAFTHPLWLFVHVPIYYLTGEVYLTTILISLLFDIAAFLLIIRLFPASIGFIFAFLLVPLFLSKAFAEYATSGLENPLTFFCLALFCYLLIKKNSDSVKFMFFIGLVANFSALNRLDTILFYLPTLIFLVFTHRHWKSWFALGLGFAPLAIWELFSLFYYGFLFPNTAYAKLSTGISARSYFQQGIIYAIDLLKYDPFSTIVILVGILFTIHTFYRNRIFNFNVLMGIGLILYCLYVLKVGGDFMSGRFWVTPFFLSVTLIYWTLQPYDNKLGWINFFLGGMLVLIFLIIFPAPSIKNIGISDTGIAQERNAYSAFMGLFNYKKGAGSLHQWKKEGMALKAKAQTQANHLPLVVIDGVIGMKGYYAGDRVTFIDQFALTDALLARLPVFDKENWRIGHFFRHLPTGYIHFHKTGSLDEMSPILAEYYAPLRLIISGPLFDTQRLKTILWFNLGYYDHFLQDYIDNVYLLERGAVLNSQNPNVTPQEKSKIYQRLSDFYQQRGYAEFSQKMYQHTQ